MLLGSLVTRRWREMDSNFRFRAKASSVIAIAGCAPENRFASDSLLEGTEFDPSVPRKARGFVLVSCSLRRLLYG
jgi:hypothetical protein